MALARAAQLVVLLAAAACGQERGRIRFAGQGAGQVDVMLEGTEVDLWTELDVEHEWDATMWYEVELIQDGEVVAVVSCNPLGPLRVKAHWRQYRDGTSYVRRGQGKMTCQATVPREGPTTVRATLTLRGEPPVLRLRRADLVVKE